MSYCWQTFIINCDSYHTYVHIVTFYLFFIMYLVLYYFHLNYSGIEINTFNLGVVYSL